MAMPGAVIRGQRSLLRQIREAVQRGGPAQERLDMVVRIIARSMVAEVCSLYMRRAGGEMELFATEGLAPDAVHLTRMRPGEGLVGEIMRLGRPLNLADAPNHPAFSYRPETGEDPYHAFLGVPLLRGGRAIGVLVVQNRTERVYTEDEVEDLQIIAMVLAEMVAGELISEDELSGVEITPHRPERIKGARFADGLALGVAVLHEPPVAPSQLLADDVVAEEARLKTAIVALQAQIDEMLEGQHGLVEASYEVLETYRMFAHDRGWNRSLEDAVRNGLTAEAAVERVRSEHRARLGQARDPYLRERLHDFEDLADRLLRHLAGDGHVARNLPDDAILIARNLGPADLLEYDRTKLKGLLLEEGSPASHAAIVARALDIPCVGRLTGLRDRVSEGDPVIVDAETGEAYLRPRPDVLQAISSRIEVRAQRRAEFARLRDTPAFTRDGVKVTLLMNAGLDVDLETLAETGAEGIGLFRTEFQFMVAEELPRFNAQTALYSRVLDAAGGMPVTFRTLDLGGDKVLPYLEAEREENPALGWRAIRMGLDRPALLRLQLRALIAAARGRPLRIMFPLVASVDEFRAARALVDHEVAWAQRRGRAAPARLDVGAMIEAPALIWHLDALLPMTDFVSVGTNDLLQYLFAADRGNARMADRYDPLSPPALRALAQIQAACEETGTPVSVCGEMAGRPLEAFTLVALGFERLSMPPAGIGPVKQMVLSCDREAARRGVMALIKGSAGSVRNEIETLARKLYLSV
ncbi:phosphoenolpyruvate--protein phosphotransferase [Phenylobacterium sp.]|uniref:phosphoenolpyruvate--protein phosphotransferase n=1 Tax=Phenylobacterium sp. TaxID=1871053 RepID=UPI0017F3541D|nr:phosphoenolpyruvate--protein phosphotransferase [Phenylobacterium sp.]MBA4794007.1 phosphoenolpyruvate--protein phosphotransferase [Phenylobacterium sp.]MBC7166447.1 phosphoenolpyruvate--protein phosphotransferase [Phenylobacterium sp.]